MNTNEMNCDVALEIVRASDIEPKKVQPTLALISLPRTFCLPFVLLQKTFAWGIVLNCVPAVAVNAG